jgi:cell division protein FtsN
MAKAAKKPAARKGASRNTRSSSRKSGGTPGWALLLLGLAVGVFAMFLWHLHELKQGKKTTHENAAVQLTDKKTTEKKTGDKNTEKAAKASPETATPKPSETPPANTEPSLDFYKILPKQQAAGKEPNAAQPLAPAKTPDSYKLQAGSFKSEDEADKRRANILMLGLPVTVQKVPTSGEQWFRIVVGPLEGKTATQEARNTLKNNGIESVVMK